MKYNPLHKLFVLVTTLFITHGSSAQCIMTAKCTGGVWSSAATWSPTGCGTVTLPGDNMTVIVPACAIVSVDINTPTYNNFGVQVYGNIYFQGGQKINIDCSGYFFIAPGGTITGENPGAKINICGSTVWNGGDPGGGPLLLGSGLPVELASFTATVDGANVGINWSTMSEKNNSHFEVERGIDAANFTMLASIPSKSNGQNVGKLDYSFVDPSPLENNSYYRLKQVDKDGSFKYSEIVSVSYSKTSEIKFTIYPNPNKGEFTADISGVENNHNVTVLLRDVQGKLVYKSDFYIQDAVRSKFNILPEHKLENGIYTCSLVVEEISYTVKVVVQ
jgi:hypothetical protein